MDAYDLIIAPSGVSLRSAAGRIGKALNAEVVDIEDEITSDPDTHAALDDIGAEFSREALNMETVTHNLPRPTVSELWKDAVARCLGKLEKSGKPRKIMSGHLIYYSSKRNEFYSVVDIASLAGKGKYTTKLRPTNVLLLIDDIYDMIARLPDLYSSSQIESTMRKMEVDPERTSNEDLSRITMGWFTRSVLHLLSWRHTEPIMGENLARQLGARFLLWPVKQLKGTVELWLKEQGSPFYLSHPITEARREKKAVGDWPELVTQVNQLQGLMLQHKVTLAAPTGIDELRFVVEKTDLGERYNGLLDSRWPIVSDPSNTLYALPSSVQDQEYTNFLSPRFWDPKSRGIVELGSDEVSQELKCQIDAFCQVLVQEIETQIASRDFLFIYHTEGLLVFRPYYGRKGKAAFSHGVDSEVRLWEDMAQLDKDNRKRIAFVHFEDDVRSMLTAKRESLTEDFANVVYSSMSSIVKNVRKEHVRSMILNRGVIQETTEILNRSSMAGATKRKLEGAFSSNHQTNKVELLRTYLSGAISVGQTPVGIWVTKDFDSFKNEAHNVSQFLENGAPRGNDWEKSVDTILPDNALSATAHS